MSLLIITVLSVIFLSLITTSDSEIYKGVSVVLFICLGLVLYTLAFLYGASVSEFLLIDFFNSEWKRYKQFIIMGHFCVLCSIVVLIKRR